MVGDSAKRPARRCLFGPVSHVDIDDFLSELDMHSEAQAKEKWGFDFRAGRPLPGMQRYDWTPLVPEAHSRMNPAVLYPVDASGGASQSSDPCLLELPVVHQISAGQDCQLSANGALEGATDRKSERALPGCHRSMGGATCGDDKLEQ